MTITTGEDKKRKENGEKDIDLGDVLEINDPDLAITPLPLSADRKDKPRISIAINPKQEEEEEEEQQADIDIDIETARTSPTSPNTLDPTVLAAVRSTDTSDPANTLRAWTLGLLFVTATAGANMFLSMRSPAVQVPGVVVQLLVYPVGCAWARWVPRRWKGVVLNPGPFGVKEHVVVTLMSNVTYGYAYATDALLALQGKPFYNISMGWGFQLLFTLSSQLIGIALSGLFRRFLVWPAAMIWPNQFGNTALFYALHDKRASDPAETDGWRISRYRLFLYIALGSFVYYWIPGVLFQGLSAFTFLTWIMPTNITINQLFGGFTGLSLLPLTFDWTYISSYLLNPLLSPTSSHLNTLLGLCIFVILPAIGISFTGALYADYLPLNTSTTYDNTQQTYNVSRILAPGAYTFDLERYRAYSPMFLAPTFALNYGLSFAALVAALVHVGLYHGRDLLRRLRQRSRDASAGLDIHMRLMRRYPEAPEWWYAVLLLVSLGLGLAATLGWATQLPWWAFFVSNIVAFVFMIPTCVILAITNIQLSLNVLSPFLAGFMIPGRPIGVMMFKVFSTITLGQAQTYSGDLKLAHYMKVPPKTTFSCQIVATIWAVFVQIAVMNWTLSHIDGVCSTTQPANFTCPNGKTFFSSSITWGVIGPARMFGPGALYSAFQWFWLLGAVLPLSFFPLARHWPRTQFLNAPVMLGATAWLPPATPLNFFSWAAVGLVGNGAVRRRWPGRWRTYNYVVAAALDAGLVLATLVVFFAITLPGVEGPRWWGNVDVLRTADAMGMAVRRVLGEGGRFGPGSW